MTITTTETVGCGHPDKICDQIADHLLDCALQDDPNVRTAFEVSLDKSVCRVFGETSWRATKERVADQVGIILEGYGLGNHDIDVSSLHGQSDCIAENLRTGGAGDQGIMYGYANRHSMSLHHPCFDTALRLADQINQVGSGAELDGKCQVTSDDLRLWVVSVSKPNVTDLQLEFPSPVDEFILNPPTGVFDLCGPYADAGVTGRKTAVDSYGGIARHGGGAFSGKDPTKVDRTGAYAARWAAIQILSELQELPEVEVSVSYLLGREQPVHFCVSRCEGKAERKANQILKRIDWRPAALIEQFSLTKPTWLYRDLASINHFWFNTPWNPTHAYFA